MRNLTKALTVVSLLAPVSGHSLGIGDIRVRSALNQNLNAEIALITSRGENPSNIKVSLAPAEKFDEAGVPWSYFLSKIKFQPIVKSNGAMVIKVTSREALKEPYLNFLLEVSWPKGNLYREFTVLVDPPADYQQQAYQEPVYQEQAYPLTSNYERTPPQQDYVPERRPARHHAAKPRRSSEGSYGGQITTRRNDTLWNVAERARGAGVSVEQMMMALYEKNPHAFYQQNVNALSAGKRLQIPEKTAVQQTSRQEALAEFSQHNEAWNNNRSGIPAGQTQAAKEEPADSQLKLEAPTEDTVAANETVSPSSEQTSGTTNAAPAQPAPASPDAAQQTTTNKGSAPVDDAVQSKIAALEKQMAMMQELIALKDKQLAELQNPAQETTPPATQTPSTQVTPPPNPPVTTPPASVTPAPVAPEQPAQVAPPAQVKPIVPTKPIVKPTVRKVVPPVQVATESSSPLVWVLGGLGAILVPLFGWLWWQKRKITQETEAESMFRNYSAMRGSDPTGAFSVIRKAGGGTASAESSFLNDFKASDFESFESFNVDHGDIDPIAEADVYLAYGRYQQAEDLIRQAIKDTPDRDECKLKLLEIFHASSNKDAFENYAIELIAKGKKDDVIFWGKVVELSKDICPNSELFTSQTPSNVAVFSAEPEELNESVLEPIADITPILGTEHLGTANFEISDEGEATFEISEGDAGESLFDTSSSTLTPEVKHQDEPIVEIAKSESKNDEPDLGISLFKSDFGGQQDNETIDFDLGPYPGSTQKVESENIQVTEASTFGSDAPKLQTSDLDDKNDFESYEFDFNLDKPEPITPNKTSATPEANDKWESQQTIDFSLDDLPDSDTFGSDIIDFSFDLEPTQTNSDKADLNQGFGVSDLTDMDEIETKLDLAKAYIDMGDAESAKDIISQVLEKGSAEQKKTAQVLLDDLNLG
ncbi:FimV/HubP family polar landmark protein [Methyloglobulus sp.]|uniref:FimV/HubP family polar landmark protein n=1 Tax=Methyloglobulus sp. TaxID=2518622 RepID=UPI0032B7E3A0